MISDRDVIEMSRRFRKTATEMREGSEWLTVHPDDMLTLLNYYDTQIERMRQYVPMSKRVS